MAAKLASKLNYSLTVSIQQQPIKSSRSSSEQRDRSASGERPRTSHRAASSSVKSARQSAKSRMKAAGLAKEQGTADMEKFIQQAEDAGDVHARGGGQ